MPCSIAIFRHNDLTIPMQEVHMVLALSRVFFAYNSLSDAATNIFFKIPHEGLKKIWSIPRLSVTFLIFIRDLSDMNPLSKLTARTFNLYLFLSKLIVYVESFPPL